jgi:hypothetical protein
VGSFCTCIKVEPELVELESCMEREGLKKAIGRAN